MTYYCSLAEARDEILATANTVDDNALLRRVQMVSRRVNQLMGGRTRRDWFWPTSKLEKVPLNARHIDSYFNTLHLRGLPPLLAITTVLADTTDVTAVTEGYPQGEPYFQMLRITSSGDPWYSYLDDCDDPAYASVTGVWGCHSDYSNAWTQVDTLAAIQTVGATTFTVADVDGADPDGITPRLSPGQLVKIESEYQLVTATNTGNNVVTATRAQGGTTAAQHASGSGVSVWQTEDPVRRIVARQAALLVARQGAFQVETVDGVGTISYPQDLLGELAAVLSEYTNGG